MLHRIGRAADIPPLEGRGTTIGGQRIAVFRTGEGFFALGGHCPHRDGPLEDGIVADACVTCPLHGWRFDLRSGSVIAGGEGAVAVYDVIERSGQLFLALDAAGKPVPRAAGSERLDRPDELVQAA